MGHEEHGGTWHGRSSTGYAKEEGEAILKTSSTTSSSSTRPAKLQLDRAGSQSDSPHGSDGNRWKRSTKSSNISCSKWRSKGLDGLVWAMILWPPRFDSHWLTPCF
ncbi:unnamed protein product [Microthlaspi erraticum]|uniref:Uncharacterized protein n=1 Tax=Microthlaspi erraticum TaxID=1685480 RepID=A0A6D2JSH4_9BRAS|nr:unnamed protein product [Microthlaspi erraticum]